MSGERRAEGALVVVGTPIGNLGDLSPRAVSALADADVLYCEDTRRTRKLLAHAGIRGADLRSLHGHNEQARLAEVLDAVRAGRMVAVVSDAGMPGISDPGERVVAAAVDEGLVVTAVPGPSAVLTALVVSGLPTARFCFEGFLPRSGRERRERLEALVGETRSVVCFEAPGRVARTLDDLAGACGPGRQAAVVRELTKVHEQVRRGTLGELAAWAGEQELRGEVVLVVAGAARAGPAEVPDSVIEATLAPRLAAGERTRGAVDAVAAELGVARRRVYRLAVQGRGAPDAGTTEESTDRAPEGNPGRASGNEAGARAVGPGAPGSPGSGRGAGDAHQHHRDQQEDPRQQRGQGGTT